MKFLAVTDLHYCERNIPGDERQNYLSARKLKEIVRSYSADCDFIVNLGDTADSQPGCSDQAQLMGEIAGILNSSGKECRCLIGNHDTSLPKKQITEILSMPHRYYSFETDEYLCLALDPNMNDVSQPYPDSEIKWAYTYIDDGQLEWIKSTIDNSDKDVLVFSHELLILERYGNINDHVIINRDKVLDVLLGSGKVKAVFCGHYHYGDYVDYKGVKFITLSSLCLYDDITFAEITIKNGKLTIAGHGRQKSMEISLA